MTTASRRSFLAGLLAAGMAPQASWADTGNPAFLAAGKTADDRFFLAGLDTAGDILFRHPLPARGHAATAHPSRPEAVAFARRPGTFADVIACVASTPCSSDLVKKAMFRLPSSRAISVDAAVRSLKAFRPDSAYSPNLPAKPENCPMVSSSILVVVSIAALASAFARFAVPAVFAFVIDHSFVLTCTTLRLPYENI